MHYKINTVCASRRSVSGQPSRTTSLFAISSVILLVLLLTFIFGCSGGNETANNSSKGYTIKIFLNNTRVAVLNLDNLLALPQVNISADGKVEEGPTLLSALALAGIQNFSQVTAIGLSKGRLAEAELVLTRDQIDAQVILDKTNQGTTKLCGPDIESNKWIIDLNTLVVK